MQAGLAVDAMFITTILYCHFDFVLRVPLLPTRFLFPLQCILFSPFSDIWPQFLPQLIRTIFKLVLQWEGDDQSPSLLCKFIGLFYRLSKGRWLQLSPRSARMQVYSEFNMSCYLSPPTMNTRSRASTEPNFLLAEY